MQTTMQPQKTVRIIEPTISQTQKYKAQATQKRVAAYCRVSTKQEEQLNSYEVQKAYYTDKITSESGWTLVDIYADKGISGTSTKKRDAFNRMVRDCKRKRIDMIITKSISRFARNTLDCIKYIRLLKEYHVDVYFEEQAIHSTDPGAEFYITIYGSIAQTESENISANVRWGKVQSAKQGRVAFSYRSFLGYRKGADDNPEIIPEEAEIVRQIYHDFLSGKSIGVIAKSLTESGVPTPMGKEKWGNSTVQSILTNEKYMGDALLQKTYIEDCISKKVRINNGARTQYYVENSHPAIIDKFTFHRAQEEMARRCGKQRISAFAKTQQGKYSSKYVLSEILVCASCGAPFRRCTWTHHGMKRHVWRCLTRIEQGKRTCDAPTMDEQDLHEAIMSAIQDTAKRNTEVLQLLKTHIGMGLQQDSGEDNTIEMTMRLAEIEAEFQKIIDSITAENHESLLGDERIEVLFAEKQELEKALAKVQVNQQMQQQTQARLDEIYTILDGLKNRPIAYEEQIVRQLIARVEVVSKGQIRVWFHDGVAVEVIV